ncbi:hypothetical protein D3C85_1811380 [compost metagenome]
MRNLDASEWLDAPNLTEVKAVTAGTVDQANVFQLSVRQTQPGEEEAIVAQSAPPAKGKQANRKGAKK